MIADALFICVTILVVYDLVNRHSNGASYRALLKKKNKTPLETKCLEECSKFFKPNVWHKAYFTVVVPAYILMAIIYDSY